MAEGTLLLSIPNVSVYLSGNALVSDNDLAVKLIDIPSSVLKAIPSSSEPPSYDADLPTPPVVVDTWLVLSFGDGLIDIPLSSSSPVSFKPPNSYIIPIASDEANQGASGKEKAKKDGDGSVTLELPNGLGSDQLETLDAILAGWTSYSGRNSANAGPTPVSVDTTRAEKESSGKGRLALMDEATGEICGELDSDIIVHGPPIPLASTSTLLHQPPHPTSILVASHEPVVVSIQNPSGDKVNGSVPVAEISSASGQGSSILSGAESVSRGIIAAADLLTNLINRGGASYLTKTAPATTPMTFSPTTKANTQRVLGFTRSATKVSGKTVSMIGGLAAKVGDQIGKSTGIQHGPKGEPPTGARGYISKGILAFNTVLDSIEYGGKKVLSTAGSTGTRMVQHSYGAEAGQLADHANQSIQNVALVYIDARGVTRKALLKSAGKAAVRGRMRDGREVMLGTDANVEEWSEKATTNDQPPQAPPQLPDRKKN